MPLLQRARPLFPLQPLNEFLGLPHRVADRLRHLHHPRARSRAQGFARWGRWCRLRRRHLAAFILPLSAFSLRLFACGTIRVRFFSHLVALSLPFLPRMMAATSLVCYLARLPACSLAPLLWMTRIR